MNFGGFSEPAAGSTGFSEVAADGGGNGAEDDDTMPSMHALTWGMLPNIKYPCRLTI